jgi:Mrp family chromosome partitioning ATPase
MKFMADYFERSRTDTEADGLLALRPANGSVSARPELAPQFNAPALHLRLPEACVEDLRKVAENLRLLAMGKPSLRVIGFTSALPREGVSTTLYRLALVMARKAGKGYAMEAQLNLEETGIVPRNAYGRPQGILLVDAQFKNPALHKMLEVEIQNGLVEMPHGEFDAEVMIKETANANLKIITTGQAGQVPAMPLDQEKLGWLFEAVKSKVEFVFVDIPPLLHSAEGVAISRLCDGVVLIVRAHQTRWEIVREAKRQLQAAKVNVLGCALNRREFFIPEWLYRKL